jgi:hypothetical protein
MTWTDREGLEGEVLTKGTAYQIANERNDGGNPQNVGLSYSVQAVQTWDV